MTTERYILAILLGLLLAVSLVAGISYVEQIKVRAAFEAQLAIDAHQIHDLDQAIAARDKETENQVAALRAAAAKIKTPQQAVGALPQIVELPKPIYMEAPVPQSSELPDAGIPHESILPLFAKLAECKEHDVLLGACQLDRDALTQKVEIVEKDRDLAVQTIRGGTWLQRIRRNSKWLLIGAGVGAVGAVAASHR